MTFKPFYISRWLPFYVVLFVILAVSGCEIIDDNRSHDEGVILYDVSFPSQRQSILVNVYPSEMKMEFKDSKVRGRIESIGGLVSTDIIVDTKKKKYWQMLSSFGEKIYCELSEEMVKQHFAPTQHEFVHEGSEEILGLDCTTYSTVAKSADMKSIQVKTTNEIEVVNPNWYTQYAGLDEVLMQYELEQFGMNMEVVAREISFQKVEDTRFEVPSNYTLVTPDSMMLKLQDLIMEIPK